MYTDVFELGLRAAGRGRCWKFVTGVGAVVVRVGVVVVVVLVVGSVAVAGVVVVG